jgi:hypothetical protein
MHKLDVITDDRKGLTTGSLLPALVAAMEAEKCWLYVDDKVDGKLFIFELVPQYQEAKA